MHIAINCRSMMGLRPTGIGRYTQQLIHHLGLVDQDNRYWLYARKDLWDRKRRLPQVQGNFQVRADYFNLGPSCIVRGCDVYHAPSLEDVSRAPGKIVVTIHDLIYKAFPQSHTPQTIELSEKFMQTVLKHAARIVCTSQSTRADLHRFFQFDETKTSVVYSGVNHDVFYVMAPEVLIEGSAWLKLKGLDGGYLLFVGTLEPRKNLIGILHALAHLKARGKLTVKLAVAGMQGWMTDAHENLIKQLGLMADVVFLGFVSDSQLALLYNKAKVFLFPSFYEGFGFPIIEAMACGCPVITSNNSSCGEIAGEAGLTVDPHQAHEIAESIDKICQDKQERELYIQRGFQRARSFNWHDCAQGILKAYQQVHRS